MENEAHKSKGNKKIKRKKYIVRRSNTCPFGDLEGAVS